MSKYDVVARRRAVAVGAVGMLALGGLALPAAGARAASADQCRQSQDCVPNSLGGGWQDSPDGPGHQGEDGKPPFPGGNQGGHGEPNWQEPHYEPKHPKPQVGHEDSPSTELPPGMDPSTATDECTPGSGCTVNPPAGDDSRFAIRGAGGQRPTVLFATTNGDYESERLGSSGAGRPDCPGYEERNSDWVQFGFLQPEGGSTWDKTATMTQRQTGSQAEMLELARTIQICFASPYEFRTREGYDLGRHGTHYAGVLPDCGGGGPCVVRREVFAIGGNWGLRIVFRVPANAKDPKALG